MSQQRIAETAPPQTLNGETLLDWSVKGLARLWRWLRRPENGIAVGIVLFAALLRFWDLGERAFHHDESLHAYYSWFLSENNIFIHNPLMHGAFQFVSTNVIFRLFGASDATARFLPALVGTLVVAVPLFLLRRQLGQWGALVSSLLLAVSPGMLYFSRFARNDIYLVLWTLLLVWTLWRFLEQPRMRYLYGALAVLAVSFATKEVTYLLLLVFVIYLVARLIPSMPTLLRTSIRSWPPAAIFLLVVGSILLPLGGAGLALVQDRLGLHLANPDPGIIVAPDTVAYLSGPIGAPISQGPGIASGLFDAIGNIIGLRLVNLVELENAEAGVLSLGGLTLQALDVATLAILVLFLVGAAIGFLWDWRRWLIAAAIFWGIFALISTTYFTNWAGLASGLWQSLGYWVAQQEVARGGQPWYYYMALLSTYEFLPLLAGFVSGGYFIWRRDSFGVFLAFWFIMALVFFIYAGEKMPWLSIHLTLPLVLLAGRGLGLLGARAFARRERLSSLRTLATLRWGVLAVTALLFVLTVQSALRASYANGDVPVEMLVYTQTSPSIADAVREIERFADVSGQGTALPVTIDTMDGFGWPWYWYLRDYTRVEYRCLGAPGNCGADARPLSEEAPAQGRVLVLNAANGGGVSETYLDGFDAGVRVPFRWWFPETAYRGPNYADGLSPLELLRGAVDPSTWSTLWTYWTKREPPLPLGRIDVVVYFPDSYSPDIVPPPDPFPETSTRPAGAT